jgi:hypothetical protein
MRQYILSYPYGSTKIDDKELDNTEAARLLVKELILGKSLALPVGWTVTIIELQTGQVSSTGVT